MNFIDRFFLNRIVKGLNPKQSSIVPINGQLIQEGDSEKYVRAYSTNADVYSIVTFLARKASSIPLYVYKKNSGTRAKIALKRYQNLSKHITQKGAFEKALIERKSAYDEQNIDESSPLATLLNKPNPNQSQDAFLENLFGYRFLSGEGFIWGNSGAIEGGKFTELYTLPSQYMEQIPDPNDLFGVKGWYLSVGGTQTNLGIEDVKNWKTWNPNFDPVLRTHMRGLSPIMSAWNLYLMGVEGQKAAATLYKNGGAKGALVPKPINNQVPNFSLEQASQMQMALSQRINNNSNAGSVALLQNAFDYINFGMTSSEMQIIDSMKFSLEQWCRVFGMPSILMSPDNSSYNNYDNALRDLVTNTIVPMLTSLRDELNSWLVPRMGNDNLFIDFDISALPEVQKDMDKLIQSLKIADWLTMDEKRIAMDYDPMGGAFDMAYISQGMIPLEQAGMSLGPDQATIDQMNKGDYPM